jgi:hypothetical protein
MSEHTEKTNEGPAVSTDNEHQEDADYGDEDMDMEDEAYLNNHDLIGVEGIIRAQRNEIEKKKVRKCCYLMLSSVGTED